MITPLRCAIDTLEATFVGTLDPFFCDTLDAAKRRAQATEEAQPVEIAGRTFYVSAKGQLLWKWTLRHDDMIVWLGTSAQVPSMRVKLLAHALASIGAESLWAAVREVGSALGLTPSNCSRVDIAVDLQGWAPTLEEFQAIVCASPARKIHFYRSEPETLTVGEGGDVEVRIYDKTKQIKKKRLEWWKSVWAANERYVAGERVERVEVQFRGGALRERGCRTVEEVFANVQALFDYGLGWCSLRTLTEDSNPSRWPLNPVWDDLRRFYAPAVPLERVSKTRRVLDYERLVRDFVSLCGRLGLALDRDDYWDTLKVVSLDGERYLEGELDQTFEEYVEHKRRQRHL